MKNYKNGFTMIELIFVIVILGILGAIAVPKFTDMKNTAELANGRSDVSAIRSAIMTERQKSLVKGDSTYITTLTPLATSTILFTGDGTRTLLSYGIQAGSGAGDWSINNFAAHTYDFNSGSDTTTFTYTPATGIFTCTAGDNDCDTLAN